MDYKKPFNFLKNLPPKLNSFYKTKSKSGLVVSNKSKSKKDFDPVTVSYTHLTLPTICSV